MSNVYTLIDLRAGTGTQFRCALDDVLRQDYDLPIAALIAAPMAGVWWRHGDPGGRSMLARALSRRGCSGWISVEPLQLDAPQDSKPPIRWTGFTARQRSGRSPRLRV